MIALTCHGSRARKDLCISETAQQSLEWCEKQQQFCRQKPLVVESRWVRGERADWFGQTGSTLYNNVCI